MEKQPSLFLEVMAGVFFGVWAFVLTGLILASLVGVHWSVGVVK